MTPFSAQAAEQVEVGRRRRAHEDEVGLAVGQVVDRGDRSTPSTVAPRGLWRRPAPVAGGEDVVQGDEAELARGGSTRRRRCTPAGRTAPRSPLAIDGRHQATSTRASTATGRPSTTISGLRSADTMVGSASAAADSADEHVDERLAVDGRLAAELAEQRLGRRGRRSAPRRRAGVSGHEPEGDVGDAPRRGRRRRRASPSCRTAGRGEPGDQLAVARAPSARPARRRRRPRVGRRRAALGGRAHGVGVAEAAAARGPARSCGRWRRRTAWRRPGSRARRRRPPPRRRRRRAARPGPARRGRPSSAFDSTSERVGHRARTVAGRDRRLPIAGHHRGLLRAAVDVGRAARGRPAACAERGMTDYVYTPEGRPEAPRTTGASPTTTPSSPASPRFAAEGALAARLRHLARACRSTATRPTTAPPSPPRSTRSSPPAPALVVLAPRRHPLRRRPQGEAHARLTTWLREHLADRADAVARPHRVRRHPVARRTSTRWPAACPPTSRSGGPGAPS